MTAKGCRIRQRAAQRGISYRTIRACHGITTAGGWNDFADKLRKKKIPILMRHRAKRTLFVLAILGLFPCGCATLTLRDAIALKTPYTREKHPRYSNGGYTDQYHGKVKWGDTEYFAFFFRNPFLTGDRPGNSGSHLGVLVPVDSSTETRAVLFENNIAWQCAVQTEEISACLRKNHVPDKLITAYNMVSCRTYREHDAYHAAAYTEFSQEKLVALQGYASISFQAPPRQKIFSRHSEPEIVGFLLDEKERPVRLFLGKWQVTEKDEPGWEWSRPYDVSACLSRPTWRQKIMPIGYLFTVAVDIATSPLQLIIFGPVLLHETR